MPKGRGVYILIELPDELHRQAKIRAAVERISLKGFTIKALHEAVATPRPAVATEQVLAAQV